MLDPHFPGRRLTSRVTAVGSWVCWTCQNHDRLSRVINLSLGGLLIEASSAIPVGETVFVSLHTQEGEIVGDAAVRHAEPLNSLGLQFTTMSDENRLRLAAVMARAARFSCLVHTPALEGEPSRLVSLQVSIRESGDITILDVRGKITIEGGSGLLDRHLKQLAGRGVHKFLLNLTDATQVDSSGLNIILETYVSLKKREGDLKLLRPRNHVLEVLRVLHLLDVIPCFDNEGEALASFKPQRHAARR